MELDDVEAPALAVVRSELRRMLVGETAVLVRLAAAAQRAELAEALGHGLPAFSLHDLLQRSIEREQVHILERRALVRHRRGRTGARTALEPPVWFIPLPRGDVRWKLHRRSSSTVQHR